MSKIPEILAPVGGYEQLIAAVRCGCDAVYLGTKGFNARKNAENFDASDLADTVSYCRVRCVKVYVTLNTLVTDGELEALDSEITAIAQAGADAVIVQDLAVAQRVREICPAMPLHASTQMSVHNLAGVKALEKLGFSRVVLARELSLSEIKAIAAQTEIELEVFVHGAHCMSVSGQCYLSCAMGGRSGNRGQCAQPCRLNYNSNGREYALSLKDMSYLSHLTQLSEAGVSSFKIEGRMKRPEYVAAVVTACRQALSGEKYDLESLRAVFSRSGFTDGYLTGNRNGDMFGVRTREDVEASGNILKSLRGLYNAEHGRRRVDMELTLTEGEPARLLAASGGVSVTVEGDVPEASSERALKKENAVAFLSKTGGTPFSAGDISFLSDAELRLSSAQINAIRREALDKLGAQLSLAPERKITDVTPFSFQPHSAPVQPEVRVRINTLKQLVIDDRISNYYIRVGDIAANPECVEQLSGRVIAQLPALLFEADFSQLQKELAIVKALGVTHVCTGNIGIADALLNEGFTVHGSAGLNITNTLALKEYEKLGLCDTEISFELSRSDASRLGGELKRGCLAYGYLPLMQLRCCPVKPSFPCDKCSGTRTIIDRRSTRFTVLCRDKKYQTLLNSVPLWCGDRLPDGMDFMTLDFTIEHAGEVSRVINAYFDGSTLGGQRTKGLSFN